MSHTARGLLPNALSQPQRRAEGPPLLLAAAAFVAVWTVYFGISESGASLHHDMAEAYAWGIEFQLGYSKHPPFWAWVCGAWFEVFPRTNASFALLTSLNAVLGLLGSWKLIGEFATGEKRIAATLLLLVTPFYTFLSFKYNANSVFLSIWPWAAYAFLRSIAGGGWSAALAFGLLMGIAALSKYYVAVLAGSLLAATLVHPRGWKYLRSPWPYLSVAVAALVFAPHGWWLVIHDAPPFHYFSGETHRESVSPLQHAVFTFLGAIAQNAIAFGLVAVVARPTWTGLRERASALRSDPRFRVMAALALGPLLFTVAAAMILQTKVSPNMTMATFSLAPLLAIEWLEPEAIQMRRYAVGLALVVTLGALLVSPLVPVARAWYSQQPMDVEPRQELALAATDFWRATTGASLVYVGGSENYDTAVAFYSGDRPHAFIMLDFQRSFWVTPELLREKGLLTVCLAADALCREAAARFATPATVTREISVSHDFAGHKGARHAFILSATPPSGL